jgi:hypothetical protein
MTDWPPVRSRSARIGAALRFGWSAWPSFRGESTFQVMLKAPSSVGRYICLASSRKNPGLLNLNSHLTSRSALTEWAMLDVESSARAWKRVGRKVI